MNNYHYIIASLPVLTPDYAFTKDTPEEWIAQILELLSEKDRKVVELLESGYDKENLGAEFYKKAIAERNRFIREFFLFDLFVRNAKVEFLNARLGRPAGTSVLTLTDEETGEAVELPEFEEEAATQTALGAADLLSREKALDQLYWDKIDALTTFDDFTLEAILGFVAKLHIVARWYALDEQTGREKFRALVDEVRGTFKGVDFKQV